MLQSVILFIPSCNLETLLHVQKDISASPFRDENRHHKHTSFCTVAHVSCSFQRACCSSFVCKLSSCVLPLPVEACPFPSLMPPSLSGTFHLGGLKFINLWHQACSTHELRKMHHPIQSLPCRSSTRLFWHFRQRVVLHLSCDRSQTAVLCGLGTSCIVPQKLFVFHCFAHAPAVAQHNTASLDYARSHVVGAGKPTQIQHFQLSATAALAGNQHSFLRQLACSIITSSLRILSFMILK